jgi:hypothetical protein
VGRGWFCVVPTMQARSEVLIRFGWCSCDACRTTCCTARFFNALIRGYPHKNLEYQNARLA